MSVGARSVTLEDIEAAAADLGGRAHRTPVEFSRALTDRTGVDVWLKCENLQRTGSFKFRGAYTRMSRLGQDEAERGVVAASAGNHAQGVALAARLLGLEATVFMPEGASLPKVAATRGYGAQVQLTGATVDEALVAARAYCRERKAAFIHPFDHPDVIAGQGTIGLELFDQRPEVGTVLVSVGGGGLLAGIATAVKARAALAGREIRVIGVQAAGAAAWPGSLAQGHPVALGTMRTIADGIAVARPGDTPFGIIASLVDDVVTVSEDALAQAQLLMLERAKLVVEPAGVAPVAALLQHPAVVEGGDGPVVAVLSGGNVDPQLLFRVIRHGLTVAGRFLTLEVTMPDRPGALVGLLQVLARAEANVLDIGHVRNSPGLHVGEVSTTVRLETRGLDHRQAVLTALAAAGYDATAD